MALYEVSMHAQPIGERNDDRLTERFCSEFEGLVGWREDDLYLVVEFEARDAGAHCRQLIPRLESSLDISVSEADLDLVDIPEIGKRVNRSRQSILQLVTGERRAAGHARFPRPLGVVGGKRIWDWGTVHEWLLAVGVIEDDGARSLSREQIYVLNAWLCQRALATADPSQTPLLPTVSPTLVTPEVPLLRSAPTDWTPVADVPIAVGYSTAMPTTLGYPGAVGGLGSSGRSV